MNAVSGRNDITEAISGTEWCYKRGLERDKLALSSKLGGKEDSRDNKSVKDGPDSTVISSRSRSTPDRNVPLT